ncbi:phosphatidylinositol mannoside acyltransferase [Streptomyces sp. NPDC003691]
MTGSTPVTARERLVDGMYGLGWTAVRKLPRPAAARLGRTVADTAWRRRGAGVLRLESNLARVVPGAGPERLAELSKAGMRSYMRYWMESFQLPEWSTRRVRDSVVIHDVDRLTDGIASDRGVILALPHLANWDLAGVWVTRVLETPFTTVAERLKPESLYDRFVAYRESLGMEVLPHAGGSAFGTLARRLRDGGLVALVADRDLSSSGVDVRYFGETARMPAGPALLAQHTGALLLPVTLWYEGDTMAGRVHPPVEVPASGTRAEKTAAMTQALADVYAAGIAEHPEDWHMLQKLWVSDLEPREPRERPAGEPAGPRGADGSGTAGGPPAPGSAAVPPASAGTGGSGTAPAEREPGEAGQPGSPGSAPGPDPEPGAGARRARTPQAPGAQDGGAG